ncbi:MAG: hypothetical protein ABJG78_10875 [Cyclobacteriaceae bacterium]
MRLQFFYPIGNFNYQFLLHAHSHIVLLGWVFNAIVAGLHWMLFKEAISRRQVLLYGLFQVSILGMLFSFPVVGYATVSILFSTLHIVLSYIWVVSIWRRTNTISGIAGEFVRWALFYLLISTIGPFSLGPIIATGGAGSNLYFMAIYFYLHFLYNGAFIFCLLGMFFWFLVEKGISIDSSKSRRMLLFMNVQCVSGIMLSVLWRQPHSFVFVIGAFAGVVQIVALILLIGIVNPVWKAFLATISRPAALLVKISFFGLILKALLQAISALPVVADLAYDVRNYTIGYLHLVFLGVITPFLFAWFDMQQFHSRRSVLSNWGLVLFLIGFVSSEFVIITQTMWGGDYYFKLLFATSLLLLIGIVLQFPRGKRRVGRSV